MTTILGVFKNYDKAERAIKELKNNKVANDDISYMYLNDDGKIKDGHTMEKAGEGTVAGATTGAVVGGIAGLVVANGILPGLGTLFVAGPLAAALGFTGAAATAVAGAATGAAVGGLIGALTNVGVDEKDVELYENYVRQGNILVIARNAPAGTKSVLEHEGATEIREYSSKS